MPACDEVWMFTEPPDLPAHGSVRHSTTTGAGNSENGHSILVVDDEALVCRAVSAMLLALGYRVFTASDGDGALRIVSAVGGPRIDLLLTDFRMPAMRGDELARRFHEACPGAGIIVMSGESPVLPATPHCEFLAKPFHAEALRDKLLAALNLDEEG